MLFWFVQKQAMLALTFEQSMLSALGILATCVIVLVKYIVSSKIAQEKREDTIHEFYKTERVSNEKRIKELQDEFTKTLLSIIHGEEDVEEDSSGSG